jgi:hypothetical protein
MAELTILRCLIAGIATARRRMQCLPSPLGIVRSLNSDAGLPDTKPGKVHISRCFSLPVVMVLDSWSC